MSTLVLKICEGRYGVAPIRIQVDGTTISHMKLYGSSDIVLLKNIAKYFEGSHISESQYKMVHDHMGGKFGVLCGYDGWIVMVEFTSSKNTDRFYHM